MFSSLATNEVCLQATYVEVTQRRRCTPLWWTASRFNDSTGLLVLGAEFQSSLSLRVNALQSMRKIRSLDHHCTQCFALLLWLASMSLHNSDMFWEEMPISRRACLSTKGIENYENILFIFQRFNLKGQAFKYIMLFLGFCYNIVNTVDWCFPVKTATLNQCIGKLRVDAFFQNQCSLLDQSLPSFDVDFHQF